MSEISSNPTKHIRLQVKRTQKYLHITTPAIRSRSRMSYFLFQLSYWTRKKREALLHWLEEKNIMNDDSNPPDENRRRTKNAWCKLLHKNYFTNTRSARILMKPFLVIRMCLSVEIIVDWWLAGTGLHVKIKMLVGMHALLCSVENSVAL